MPHKFGCLICGKPLKYRKGHSKLRCYYCGNSYEANASCTEGHYVYDFCHSAGAFGLIERFCIDTKLEDPIEIAQALMRAPPLKMHGPEHHFLVPAALVAAYANVKGISLAERRRLIGEARKRAKNILGGFCGFYGDCGAAVGTGIFVSVITGSTPLKKEEWRLSNLMTARSLKIIAESGGPRCCKRNTFIAIAEAVAFLREEMDVELKSKDNIVCGFSRLNKECLEKSCRFYPTGLKKRAR